MPKTSSNRLLVAGFEAFGRSTFNPSADIALPAVQELDGVDTVRLPVEFDTAFNVLRDAYDPEQHDAVLIFGLGTQASRAANIETRARNLNYSLLYADNAGKRRVGNVIKGAEWSLPTTADTTAIKQGIESTGVRARFSRDAGTYVCNHVLYSALHDFDASVGFVHLAKRMNHDEVVATARGSVRALKG